MNETNNADNKPPPRLKAGITFNLKKNTGADTAAADAEAEFDDEGTIAAIADALTAYGFTTALFDAEEDLPARLLRDRPDIVFNIAEGRGGRGREAQVPAILNFLRIPFTGSDETTLCIAMDKALTKRLVASYGVNTPKYALVRYGVPSREEAAFAYPVIIKPNSEGSSKGVSDFSIAEDAAGMKRLLAEKMAAYRQDMLLEEYISGREFTVGVLGNGDDLRVFPPMEIIFNDKSHSIYSYEVKRNYRQYVRYECPPRIGADLRKEIEDAAETVYRVLECRDFARMDFRLSQAGRLYFIEINPLAGLAPGYSDFPMIAEFCGMDYVALIRKIMDSALARYGLRHRGKAEQK